MVEFRHSAGRIPAVDRQLGAGDETRFVTGAGIEREPDRPAAAAAYFSGDRFRALRSLSVTITRAPSPASVSDAARPMPAAAPVTKVTFPASLFMPSAPCARRPP